MNEGLQRAIELLEEHMEKQSEYEGDWYAQEGMQHAIELLRKELEEK